MIHGLLVLLVLYITTFLVQIIKLLDVLGIA